MKKDEENFLDIIPVKLHLDCKKQDGNIHLVFTHITLLQIFLRWMTKKSNVSTLELDGLGSLVWENIDGKNTIYEIINILLKIEEDRYESMQQRVFMFIRILKNRKIIAFKESN
ncbi:MAG: PqqD family protein [Psychrilyobacter sp.]|uniref:PqqD family protein n=1 Tax=Psychrilyobacter sp. TaxID=2586924 RepID=UPI003C71F7D5